MDRALKSIPGVAEVTLLLSARKASVAYDPTSTSPEEIRKAVEAAGYVIESLEKEVPQPSPLAGFSRRIMTLFGIVFGAVLCVVLLGEWLGLFESLTKTIPWPVWLAVTVAGGWPVLVQVVKAGLKGRVISHTLMTVGMLAAIAVDEWPAALIVVFFMRVGGYVEGFTAEQARRAVKDLTAMAPQTARVERAGVEVEVPVAEVKVGDTVVVRPGEKIPVDGKVMAGQATVDQATITGESMPVEAGPGSQVFAATIARLGGLRVHALKIGEDTTFGRVVKLVEEAEGNRGEVQRFADKFSGYYLPVVAGIAGLTYILSRNPLATAAVLVVVCSCSIALATPIAMIASIGAGARRGILIKGGKYLETLARADVLLLDKTGTLTLGRPRITEVIQLGALSEIEVVTLAASAERYSEHPLAEAVRCKARDLNVVLLEPGDFEAIPGLGVKARVEGRVVEVGSHRIVPDAASFPLVGELESLGKTLLFVVLDGMPVGLLAASDSLRSEVPEALANIRRLGIVRVELLTGDSELVAAPLAQRLGMTHRAGLLPEDKIAVVKEYQAKGHTVVMVGDGVNDAPALAQADVGIAMGAAGSDIAIQAAHIALMREDWALIPEVFHIARRTMKVVRLNLIFTGCYNVAGLAFAALGMLPLTLAAALQSLPDIGVLVNSSRLLRNKTPQNSKDANFG